MICFFPGVTIYTASQQIQKESFSRCYYCFAINSKESFLQVLLLLRNKFKMNHENKK